MHERHGSGRLADMGAFVRHYVEMVVAMFAGMAAWRLPTRMLLPPEASPDPVIDVLVMYAAMTAPMVLWMRFRGHSWRHGAEMSAAMIVPAAPFSAAGLIWPDLPLANFLAHVAMLLGMLALMVVQRDAYAGHGHAHGAAHDHRHAPGAMAGGAHAGHAGHVAD